MFDMINIFEVFLPQLLRYPNPTDPLNGEAAALLIREPKSYDVKVKGAQRPSILISDPMLTVEQSMCRNTPTRMLQTRLAPRARMMMTCPRLLASATTTKSPRARWMMYRAPHRHRISSTSDCFSRRNGIKARQGAFIGRSYNHPDGPPPQTGLDRILFPGVKVGRDISLRFSHLVGQD